MEYIAVVLAFFVGLILGFIFFGGLWLTVRLVANSSFSAFWLLFSFVVRAALLLVGMYFIAAGRWERMVACLAGIVLARVVTLRIVSSKIRTT